MVSPSVNASNLCDEVIIWTYCRCFLCFLQIGLFTAKSADVKSACTGGTCASNTYARGTYTRNGFSVVGSCIKGASFGDTIMEGVNIESTHTGSAGAVKHSRIYSQFISILEIGSAGLEI